MTLALAGRRLLPAAILGLILFSGLALSQMAPDAIRSQLDRTLIWLSTTGEWGAALFMVLQIAIAVSGLLPASLLGLAAGAVYGVPIGFAISAAGTMVGAWIAFRLARSLFRGPIERHLSKRPRLRQIDSRMGRENWKLVCLMRVSPVMPFAITSYALGLSSIPSSSYLLGTLFAMPALLGYVVLGSIAQVGFHAEQAGTSPYKWALLGVGAVATLVLTAKVGQLVRLALKEGNADLDDGARVEV